MKLSVDNINKKSPYWVIQLKRANTIYNVQPK